ncbi:hypothetical protein [Neptunomonas phycophila]|uniref:hypothetical protein n=1 Tax=Neptunomonas phycophila TaxID=1572645 RepID=UPI0015B92424|nr:hypothetical protein [Neptunomonas phycophila]QLE97552.1 hypothetical protein FLM49_07945 [Neptunomonas phycophila]
MKKIFATVVLSAAFSLPAIAADDASDINAVFALDAADSAQVEVLSQEEMQNTEGAFFLHYLFGGLFHHKYHYFGGHYGYGYGHGHGGHNGGHGGGHIPCGC